MAGLRETRQFLLMAYQDDMIDDEDFAFLYDINRSTNPDFPYWTYQPFDLDKMDDSECWNEFRFLKSDVFRLCDALQMPDYIRTYNRMRVCGVEALCIFLRRFSYPIRYADMMHRFGGRPVPELCVITNHVMDFIYEKWKHLLDDFNLPFMQPTDLEDYCRAIHAKGAFLDSCFGFVDGTLRPISRPGRDQNTVYNGHKKTHGIKFQSVVVPNGLIAHMYGPVEGKRHDVRMLAMSNLLPKLQLHAHNTLGNPLCIYGDPAYQIQVHLQAPFRNVNLTPLQQAFNTSMSSVRVSVEWLFGDIVNWFKFIDFKKQLQLYLSPIGKMYLVCAILTNSRTCLYGNLTSSYFNCEPPSLEEYFV